MERIANEENINKIGNSSMNNLIGGFRNQIKILSNSTDKNIGIFKILKLSKRKWTTNQRMLVVTEHAISYYNIPPRKKVDKFLDLFEKLYSPTNTKISNARLEEEERMGNELCKEFYENKDVFDLFKKEEIALDMCEIIYEVSERDNPKKFDNCVMIKKSSEKKNEPLIFEDIRKKKKGETKTSGDKLNKETIWIFSFSDQIYLDRYKKLIGEIKRIKKGIIDPPQQLSMQREGNNAKQQKKEEETPLKEEKKKDDNQKETEADIIQLTYTNEICYQLLLKQYYWVSNNMSNPAIKMKHEFAILQMTTKFKEVCQNLVKRIVSDLYSKNIFSHNQANTNWSYSLFPIVFPHPQKLKKQEQAVFLYFIGGINFTLTWHQTIFKMRNEKGVVEESKIKGAWDNLNIEFKNRDFFQDLMIKLSREHKLKCDMPRYPISCLIDYCGFRVLCEADIYVDDGGSTVLKRNDIGMNQQMKDESYDFYRTISQILSSEKSAYSMSNNLSMNNVSNIKSDREYAFQNPETLIYVSYQREIRQKQLSYFQGAINHHNKQFKEVDNYIFKNSDIFKILMKGYNSDKKKNNTNSGIASNMTGMLDADNSLLNKEHLKENNSILNSSNYELNTENKILNINSNKVSDIYDLLSNPNYQSSQGIKDLKDMVYIMDLKLLKEIEEKVFEDNKKKQSSSNSQTINSNSSKRSVYFRPEFLMRYMEEEAGNNPLLDKDIDNADKFIKNLKKILQIEGDTGNPHYPNTNGARIYFKEHHINYFMNCLDTMHFKPYDSSSLSEVFHQYGVNMYYLGLVAESTSAPHIRELCMIEMIARECKKMIFDIIALRLVERANEEYYINDQGKNYVEYDYINSTSDPYPQFVPVSFFLRYYRDYLKKIQILNTDLFKCSYIDDLNKANIVSSKGLYRLFWIKRTGFSDKDVKYFLQPKEEKSGKSKDNSNEKQMLNEANKEIVKFLNVLMNFEDKLDLNILGDKYKNSTLWAFIFERIKAHYNIENKEIFSYCEPQFISLPALLNSIQYHTGIVLNIPLVNNTKINNESFINREFYEDWIVEIKPVTKVYSYRTFNVNKNKYDTIINDYSITYNEGLNQKILLRYLTEKFQKETSTFTWTNLLYSSLLHKMDTKSSDAVVTWIFKNDPDLKDKVKGENDMVDYFRSQLMQNTLKFESIHYLFLILIEPFSNYIKEDSHNINQTSLNGSKIGGLSIFADLNTAVEYIGEYWINRKHPYLCLLYVLIARLYSKSKSNLADDKIEAYYEQALLIAKDALGSNNVFVANLCVEIGIFYVKNKNYYEGTKHLLISHNVFKTLKEEFFECYIKILKKITKYFIILGYYKEALEYGSELVESYLSYMKIMNSNISSLVDIKVILFNLILICRSMSKHEKGLEFCKSLVYDLNGNKPDLNYEISKFKDWRHVASPKKKAVSNNNFKLTNEQLEEDKYKKVSLFRLIKIYLQLIIRNLKDIDRLIYIQALVKLIENKKEKEFLESLPNDPDKLFESFFTSIKEEGEFGKIFAKILYTIGPKYEQEKLLESTNALDENQKEMWRRFRVLYRMFSKHQVFTSLIDTDIYSYSYGK